MDVFPISRRKVFQSFDILYSKVGLLSKECVYSKFLDLIHYTEFYFLFLDRDINNKDKKMLISKLYKINSSKKKYLELNFVMIQEVK